MSHATVLEFASDLRVRNLPFTDLEIRLEKYLEQVKSLSDLETLIRAIKSVLRDKQFAPTELERLKKLRQRAYDRKRHSRLHGATRKPCITKEASHSPSVRSEPKPLMRSIGKSLEQKTPTSTAASDTKYLVQLASKLLALAITSSLVCFFLWHQSLALYESAGFANAIFAAAGGILMIVGFAAYHAITRSWLALFFCIYAGAYEGYLMISGTIEDEHQIQIQTIQTNPDLVFLKEKAAKSLAYYHEQKQRYDNPESKVFKNDWFLKTQLNPAWQESAAAHKELMAKESALTGAMQSGHITWLKIFYRLGLVFLCMMLVHRFFAVWVGRQEERYDHITT